MKKQKLKQTFGIAPSYESQPAAATVLSRLTNKQTAPAARPATEVTARIDVGFGNAVYIRGQGDSLNWEKGLPMRCVGASQWVYASSQVKEKLVFRLLLNDAVWARGDDLILDAGEKVELVPVF